jgi:hypothetical protein
MFIVDIIGMKSYIINDDGSIDVEGDVDLSYAGLTKLPIYFNYVSGNFYCQWNELTSLEGCPKVVGGNFYCSVNQLTSLEYAPKKVVGSFYCSYNKLTSLVGPKEVGGDFICYDNPLPKEIIDNPKAYLNQLNRDISLNLILSD